MELAIAPLPVYLYECLHGEVRNGHIYLGLYGTVDFERWLYFFDLSFVRHLVSIEESRSRARDMCNLVGGAQCHRSVLVELGLRHFHIVGDIPILGYGFVRDMHIRVYGFIHWAEGIGMPLLQFQIGDEVKVAVTERTHLAQYVEEITKFLKLSVMVTQITEKRVKISFVHHFQALFKLQFWGFS